MLVAIAESQTLDGSGNAISSRVTSDPVQAADRGLVVQVGASALPTGAATSALQTTGNSSLSSIDGKVPALGQALAAASTPVVLPAAQITTLTPPAAITGFALETTQSTQNTRIGDVTETSPGTDTASSGLNGRLQRIAQRLTSLISLIPASLGQKTMANSMAVVLASDQSAVPVSFASPTDQTFGASATSIAVAVSATDIFTITGSATKTIAIKRISVSAIATSPSNAIIQLIKRSTANTGGTSTASTAVPYDSNNGVASATVLAYTANPTTGTQVGILNSTRLPVGVGAPGNSTPIASAERDLFLSSSRGQDIILRGVSQVLAINLSGVTIAGGSFSCDVEWTEV